MLEEDVVSGWWSLPGSLVRERRLGARSSGRVEADMGAAMAARAGIEQAEHTGHSLRDVAQDLARTEVLPAAR